MKFIMKIEMVLVLAAVVFVGGCLEAEKTDVGRDRQQRMETQIEEIKKQEKKSKHIKLFILTKTLKKEDIKFTFYGKVLDFSGNPVPDVTVKASVSHFKFTADLCSGTKKIEVKTDGNGLFSFTAKGKTLGFEGFEKTGYEYNRMWEQNKANRSFKFGKAYRSDDFKFKRDEPIVYTLRKRGPAEWLYEDHFYVRWNMEKKNIYEFRLLDRWIDTFGSFHKAISTEKKKHFHERRRNLERGLTIEQLPDYLKDEIDMEYDVRITSGNPSDEKKWEISFDFIGDNGGIILSDELLYEAPLNGYQQQIRIYGPKNKTIAYEKDGYLYVKSDGGNLYSRLEFQIRIHRTRGPQFLVVDGDIYTNPEGSRNLEYDADYIIKENMRRRATGKRFKKIKTDVWARYYENRKIKKNTPMPDNKKLEEKFKKMIRQERKAGNGNANN